MSQHSQLAPAGDFASREFPSDYVNGRGIPRVEFIENVEAHIKQRGVGVDTILAQTNEMHQKLKFMLVKLEQNRNGLQSRLPEIRKTIDAVEFLKAKADASEDVETHFGLTESAFCEAKITPQKTLHLWLGANVMAEYTFDEALATLTKSVTSCVENLNKFLEDIAFLTEQKIICEVNMSRVYNYEVLRRKSEAEAAKAQ